MESLYKLYSNEYFGIGLFIVVTILAFSFLIILFFGKKDEKKREMQKQIEYNNEEEEILDAQSLNSMTIDSSEANNMNMSEIVAPEVPIVKNTEVEQPASSTQEEPIDPFASSAIILDNNEAKVNNLEDLSNSIDEEFNNSTMLEELVAQDLNPFMTEFNIDSKPVIEEDPLPSIFATEEETKINNVETPKPKPTFSNQFSSVYINKKSEETVLEQNKEEEIKPVKPEFELPKTIDLPKLNKEVTNNDSIIKSISDNSTGIDNIINSLEDESFTIEKE